MCLELARKVAGVQAVLGQKCALHGVVNALIAGAVEDGEDCHARRQAGRPERIEDLNQGSVPSWPILPPPSERGGIPRKTAHLRRPARFCASAMAKGVYIRGKDGGFRLPKRIRAAARAAAPARGNATGPPGGRHDRLSGSQLRVVAPSTGRGPIATRVPGPPVRHFAEGWCGREGWRRVRRAKGSPRNWRAHCNASASLPWNSTES